MEVIEQLEVFLLDRLAVEVGERLRECAEVVRQRREEPVRVEDQLVDVADARGEREPDASLAVRPDGAVAELRRPRYYQAYAVFSLTTSSTSHPRTWRSRNIWSTDLR